MSFRLLNYIIAYALVGILLTFLAGFVYFKDKNKSLFRIFALYNLSIAWWCFFSIPAILSRDHAIGVIWCRIFIAGVIFTPTLVLHCAYLLLDYLKERKHQIILRCSYALSFLFFILDFTPLLIKAAEQKQTFLSYTVPGPFFHLHVLHFFVVMVYGEVLYLVHYLKVKDKNRKESRKYLYYFISAFIATLGGGTNYFPVYRFEIPILNPFGTYIIIFYGLVVTYTIIRYRLLNSSMLLTRTGIFLTVYTLVLGLPFLYAYWSKAGLIRLLGANWWVGPLALMGLLATVGPYMFIFLQKRAEALLLREQRRYQEALKQAAAGMTRIHNLDKLLNFIVDTLTKKVRISHAAIYLREPGSADFSLKGWRNIKKAQPTSLSRSNLLVESLQKQRNPLVYEEIKQQAEESSDPALIEMEKEMRSLQANAVIASFLEDEMLAVIILGNKHSGKMYTSDDLDIFSFLASGAALAIENAQLYGNIEKQVKERTQELVEVQKQLVHAEKLATVGTLAGGVAHEINNPLAAIMTNVQMLLAGDELDRESLEMIEEATKRCKTIVQKLMTFAQKPMANTMMYQVNLIEVIQRTIEFLKFQLEQENIAIKVRADKESYPVQGNHDELNQVLTNLVLNAKDAIKQIKKSGTIEITLAEKDNFFQIRIKDEGAGIPKEIMNRIFDPFYTTKEVGKGLGLGLSISQTIIEKHKGKISVESQINQGSTFTIQLPKK